MASTTPPPEEMQEICKKVCEHRHWTPEMAWERAILISDILRMKSPTEGLMYISKTITERQA